MKSKQKQSGISKKIIAEKSIPNKTKSNTSSKNIFFNSIEQFLNKYAFGITITLILLICLIVFKDFLFLKKVYIFKDIGSDTVNVDYPSLQLSEIMKKNGWSHFWTFYIGMGYPYYTGIFVPETYLMKIFEFISNLLYGNDFVYRSPILIIANILIIGSLFYAYLRTVEFSKFVSLIGTLIFSFLGFTILGSSWGYHRGVLFAVMLLFSFEQLYKKGRWYFFPFAVIYMSDLYYCYLFGFFLLIYATLRFSEQTVFEIKKYILTLIKMFFLGVLGFAMNIVNSLSSLLLILDSPRVSGNAAYFKNISGSDAFNYDFGFEKFTALMRSFSSDMVGNGANFHGWYNYLEAPLFYVGLISLLLFVQVFVHLNQKQKIIYSIFAGFWLLVAFVPQVRFALLLYTGNYYKIGINIFIAFAILFLALKSLQFIELKKKVNVIVLLITLVLFLIALLYPYKYNGINPVDVTLRNFTIFILIVYALLIYSLTKKNITVYVKIALVFILVIELSYLSSHTVNKRISYGNTEYKTQKFGYNDNTVPALKYVQDIEKGFYRVEKDYASGNSMHGSLNDAQAQGYFGTACYSSFNQKYYIRFLEEANIIKKGEETQTRWAPGLRTRPLLQTIASVKYNLSKSEKPYQLNVGYSAIAKYGDVVLLKNNYFLPFGFTYDSCISLSEYQKLSILQKDVVMLRAFVAEENSTINHTFSKLNFKDTVKTFNFDYYTKFTQNLRKDTLQISSFQHHEIVGSIVLEKNKMLFLSIPYDKGWHAEVDNKPTKIELINVGFCGIHLEKGKHEIKLYYRPQYLTESAIISGISCLIYLGLIGLTCFFNQKKKSKIIQNSTL